VFVHKATITLPESTAYDQSVMPAR
jgi:hypothetical protein